MLRFVGQTETKNDVTLTTEYYLAIQSGSDFEVYLEKIENILSAKFVAIEFDQNDNNNTRTNTLCSFWVVPRLGTYSSWGSKAPTLQS